MTRARQTRSLISKRVVLRRPLSKLSTMQCLLAEALSPDLKATSCTLEPTSPSVPRPITPPLDSDPLSEDESEPLAKFRKLKVDAAKESELVVALVAAQYEAQSLSPASMDETLRGYASNSDADAFYAVDLGVALSRWEEWCAALPRLVPFYAVKCCNEPALLETLSRLGCSFDCASPAEMQMVMAHGATPDRIIYAHAVKPQSHIAAARAMGVELMTFDSIYELDKVKATHPSASMVLRIHAADPHARCQLGNKFGALPYEVEGLLLHALKLNMHVRGVSFHIGSGATGTHAYTAAIEQARGVFDLAERLGLPPLTLLDIGGGFSKNTLRPAAAAITAALDMHFPVDSGVEVIAEPGRFFAESTHTLCCAVYGKRVRPQLKDVKADTHQVLNAPIHAFTYPCTHEPPP
jgi:diaminopimelate decarboxylase